MSLSTLTGTKSSMKTLQMSRAIPSVKMDYKLNVSYIQYPFAFF